MNVISVSISACIWQADHFNPLLVRHKSGVWGFPAEVFNPETDKNFVRQTLERGLFQHLRGSLNPIHAHRKGVLPLELAAPMPSVHLADAFGNPSLKLRKDDRTLHVHIVMPVFLARRGTETAHPSSTDSLAHIQARGEYVMPLVTDVMNANRQKWRELKQVPQVRALRPAFLDTAKELKKRGVGPELAERITRPHNDGYWPIPLHTLQSVA